MSNGFELNMVNKRLGERVQPALDAARADHGHDRNKRGVVFAQIQERGTNKNSLYITGAYLPHRWAERIDAILLDYRETILLDERAAAADTDG